MTDNLTRDEARERRALIRDVRYEVDLDLSAGDRFRSETVVRFLCDRPGASTFLDLTAERPERIEANGRVLGPEAHDGNRIHVDDLASENEVRVVFASAYSTSGEGAMRFTDPVDGASYAYTDLEPFGAHHVYPCFDQPDLKASFRFTVLAPVGWEVVANQQAGGAPEVVGPSARWTFPPTPPLPPYLTVIAAGPWHAVRDRHRDVPLGVFCRRSLAEHLDPEEILEVTKQGLDFFERAFGHPYAFGKYDQVFVPAFLAGAMENPGCVTFNERYIFRARVTDARRERRAGTILHEMAHMWFGDLVTMRWWDDLWLNETFASFAGELATERATRFTDAWTTFAHTEKSWAARQDQLPTTHPIVADVPDVESALLNFDGITYAKGASVIRQLVAWVGLEQFFEGMKLYFGRHAFGNADLSDFLAALEEASGRDLHAWSGEWLETSGMNTLQADVETHEGSIKKLSIAQRPADRSRSQRVAIGLYYAENEKIVRRRRFEVDLTGPHAEVPEAIGAPLPDLTLANDDDLTFAKVALDAAALATVRARLSGIDGSLARAVCWRALWDLTRDGELAARHYLQTVLEHVGGEVNPAAMQGLLGQAQTAVVAYADPADRGAAGSALASHALEAIGAGPPGSDRQLVWAHTFISMARSPEHLRTIRGMLDGDVSFDGLSVDTDIRWRAIRALAAAGREDGLVDAELERDPTDQGQREAAAARAARPTQAAKDEAWSRFVQDRTSPLAFLESAMGGFQPPAQEELLRPYAARYFEAILPVWKERNRTHALAFAERLFPSMVVEERTIELTDAALSRGDLPGPLRRILLEGRDGLLRARRARRTDAAAGRGFPPATPGG